MTDLRLEAPASAPSTGAASPTTVRLALLTLALGGFAIGTTEFMTMGLLPDIARDIGETNARTGHIITAYAFGVVVGAPVIVALAARLPRRGLVASLILLLGLGNGLTALVDGYGPVMLTRFLSGLPHGAYFGVASLIAASLVPASQKGRAISTIMLGLSVATVAGVPASTLLGQQLSWRAAYWAVLAISVLAAALILVAVPHQPGRPDASIRGELSAFGRPQVWFAFFAGVVGFGGLFAMYTFIAPLITDVTGLSRSAVPIALLVQGVGSVVGAWLAGRLADWNVERTVIGGFVTLGVALFALWALAAHASAVFTLIFVVGVLGSVIAITLQIRLMEVAGDAEMLGSALNHSGLNVGNGLGAWLGSTVVAAGYGYETASLVGVGLAAGGVLIFGLGLLFATRRRPGTA